MAAQSRRHDRVMSGHLKWLEAEKVSACLQRTVNTLPPPPPPASFYVSARQQHRNQTITARGAGGSRPPLHRRIQ